MYLPPFIMAILNNSIAYKNITESYYYSYYDWRVFFILDVGIEEALYTEVSSFQGLEMMLFHYNTKVSISGSWNRGVPLYTFPNTVFGSNSWSTFEVRLPADSPTSYC